MMRIPRTMSTQHPDNVTIPFFASSPVLEGDDEIKEAFYVYSHLKCEEQLWDSEGKEVDSFVVKKLLTRYEPFFKKQKLGRDCFLTLRVPNPDVEKKEAKVLPETLESIPKSYDIASIFYGEDIAPIFEIAIPMCTSSRTLLRTKMYYEKIVIGKEHTLIDNEPLSEWIGPFNPKTIRIIPLLEDRESMLNAHRITGEFIAAARIEEYQRVWLARSDPALNYGSLAAVLLNKIALQRLQRVQDETGISILPILGCGSAPFRGNLKPTNLNCLDGYPSVQTFTIQSAFKYDYERGDVTRALERMQAWRRSEPVPVDEEKALALIDKLIAAYQQHIAGLAPIINAFSLFVPQRRKRHLHIGLFGYSRSQNTVRLPRAIPFCASLYSLGLPPELLGLDVLSPEDLAFLENVYRGFRDDMRDALQFYNPDTLSFFPKPVAKAAARAAALFEYETNEAHKSLTGRMAAAFSSKSKNKELADCIIEAAHVRRFLG